MVLHPCTAGLLGVFTQCSNCNTIFEVSAEVLRAAGGQVRCGRCGEIFNGFARLAEDPGAFETGESAFEMEERADSILESVVAEQTLETSLQPEEDEQDFGAPQIARLQVLDFDEESIVDPSVEDMAAEPAMDEDYPEAALEFTLPPGELDRIFVESSIGIMPLQPAPVAPDIEVVADDGSSAVSTEGSPAAELGESDLREAPKSRALSFALWSSAAVAAALLLVGQVVHHNRQALTAQGPLAPLLRALYERVGTPVDEAPNLSVFQLRQWGVTGEAASDAILRVRASILNTSSHAQPFPLLRVTLANRFGARIGSRDFAPHEYLGKPAAGPLAPGERVDAILDLVDPGKEAEGFELDVCLPDGGKHIVCASDLASQGRQ